MLSFTEEKAYFANKGYDKDGFPDVDRDFMQYSKASRHSLKQLATNYKIDSRGTKKQLITRILQRLHSPAEVSGYYNKTGDSEFKHLKKGENTATDPRSYEKVDEVFLNEAKVGRIVRNADDVKRMAHMSPSKTARVLINNDTGRMHATPTGQRHRTDHSDIADSHYRFHWKQPSRLTPGTVRHSPTGKWVAEYNGGWTSLKKKIGSEEDFHNHPIIKDITKEEEK
jgi:hypothetical protein